jgi:acyl-CoA thioesterase
VDVSRYPKTERDEREAIEVSTVHHVLSVQHLDDDRWTAPHPDQDPEKRDVVFSGQLLGQMLMVASSAADESKEIKSIHAVFARTGAYSLGNIEYQRDEMHAGRAWASNTITAFQNDRLLARSLVLLNTLEPDLIRHAASMPTLPDPDDCDPQPILVVFPGSEVRPVELPDATSADGAPVSYYWVHPPEGIGSIAETQAVIAWCQPGFTIGAAMQPHGGTIRLSDSHRSISTGVISHTAHFHDHGRADEWLLVASTASYAGHGRVFGSGSVFSRDGTLLSTFGQDAMVRAANRALDARTAL